MIVEEIELKINQDNDEVEKLLLNQGFEVFFKRRTIANYYLPKDQEIGDTKTLKERCVRIRTSCKINEKIGKFSFKMLNNLKSRDEETLSLKEAKKKEKQMLKNGYTLIHTDDKTDFVYVLKDKEIVFQIQDIVGLGTIVAYDNKNYYKFSKKKQGEKLVADVEYYGIKIKDYAQVNRFEMLGKTKKLSIKEIIKMLKTL